MRCGMGIAIRIHLSLLHYTVENWPNFANEVGPWLVAVTSKQADRREERNRMKDEKGRKILCHG